jgi:hypothetical protein
MERKPVKRGVTLIMRTTMYTSFTAGHLVGVVATLDIPAIRVPEPGAPLK